MRKCAIGHCVQMVPESRVMCFTHWQLVSPETRWDIYQLAKYAPSTPPYFAAVRRAIQQVQKALTP